MKALFAGSFDPPTLGHLDLIGRSSKIFDEVVVCIFVNSQKKGMFPLDRRFDMLGAMCADLKNVRVDVFDGMLTDYAKENGIDVLVRGIRDAADAAYEQHLIDAYHSQYPELEAILLPASEKTRWVSSTVARDVITYGGKLDGILPPEVIALL